MNSNQINSNLIAALAHVETLEESARSLSLKALSDKAAAKDYSALKAEIKRSRDDIDVMNEALSQARKQEAADSAADKSAAQAAHLGTAGNQAFELIEIAAKADQAIADFLALADNLDRTEKAIWSSLRAANYMPEGAAIGRNNIKGKAYERIKVAVERLRVADQRTVAETARVAWAEIVPMGEI